MKRGDLATVVSSGDYGKPQPALIVQAHAYAGHSSPTVPPLTSELHDMPTLRVTAEPGHSTGLRRRSQVMVDKATTISRVKAGNRISRLDKAALASMGRASATFLSTK